MDGMISRNKSKAQVIWLIFGVTISGLFILNLVSYELELLGTKFFVEPAENEQLVFLTALKGNSVKTTHDCLNLGVLPVYPNLFFELGKLFEFVSANSLYNLRLISILLHLIMMLIFSFFTFYISGSLALSLILTCSLYGSAQHLTYFLMARPDGVFFFFGFLSLLIYFYYQKKNQDSYIKFLWIGILLSLSVISKQTGLYFVIVVMSLVLLKVSFKRQSLLFIPYLAAIITIAILSNFIFFPYGWTGFVVGLEVFGSEFSLTHVRQQIIDGISEYSFLAVGCLVSIFSSCWRNRKFDLGLIVIYGFITIIISIKLFSNNAAHFNNYILLTSAASIVIAMCYSNAKYKNIIMTCIIFNYFSNHVSFAGTSKIFKIKNYQQKIIDSGDIEDDEVFSYIKKNPGLYLTGRNDNYIIFAGKEVIYEGSVLGSIYFHQTHKGLSIEEGLLKYKNRIIKLIDQKQFAGILVGIGGWAHSNYPNLRNYYKLKTVKTVNIGDWPHKIEFWIPKT